MDDWHGWEVRCGDLREQNLNRGRATAWLQDRLRNGAQTRDLYAHWNGSRVSVFSATVGGTRYVSLRGPDGLVWPYEDQ